MGIGDWGLGIGDWGLGIGPNPQSPIPNPQSPIPIIDIITVLNIFSICNMYFYLKYNYQFIIITMHCILIPPTINLNTMLLKYFIHLNLKVLSSLCQ